MIFDLTDVMLSITSYAAVILGLYVAGRFGKG